MLGRACERARGRVRALSPECERAHVALGICRHLQGINNYAAVMKPVRPCVWEKILAFQLSRYFGFPGISKSETSPVYGSEFRMSENFAKLTENVH